MTTTADPVLASLLSAVRASPEDDFPRLAYADRLEEGGNMACAEFIRLGLKLEHPPEAPWSIPLLHACRDVLPRAQYAFNLPAADYFVGPLAPNRRSATPALCFRRGFVALVCCTLDWWLRNGRALVRQQPIEQVAISDRQPIHDSLFTGYAYLIDSTAHDDAATDRKHLLPPCILDRLPVTGSDGESRIWVTYESALGASDSLSTGCIAWAKGAPLLRAAVRYFDVEGTIHETPKGCCRDMGCSPCERCSGHVHETRAGERHLRQCEECWHVNP